MVTKSKWDNLKELKGVLFNKYIDKFRLLPVIVKKSKKFIVCYYSNVHSYYLISLGC